MCIRDSHSYDPAWDDGLYATTAVEEFDAVTATVYMPYGPHPSQDVIDTQPLDELVAWARSNDLRVHGHTLLYPSRNVSLDWYQNLNGGHRGVLENYVRTVASSNAGDNVSHTFARLSWNPEGQYFCPDSHPYRIPQITYRIRYRIPGSENWGNLDNSPSTQGTQADTLSTYHLSCDDAPNRPDGPASQTRGWCLHGDWLGAWNDGVVSHWTDGCFQQDVQPAQNRVGMNCANGQTNTAFGLDLFEGSGVTDRTKYDGESRGWTQPIPAGGH